MEEDIGDFKISKKLREKLKDKKLMKKEFALGKTAQDIMGFSDEAMAKFYGAAHRLFDHQRYEDAGKAFLFLVTLNPFVHDYWLGVGMCAQMTGDHESAVDAYEMAAICQLDSPVPYFYLAKCLFSMHERDSAMQALALAIEYAGDQPEFYELRQQAIAAQSILHKDKSIKRS